MLPCKLNILSINQYLTDEKMILENKVNFLKVEEQDTSLFHSLLVKVKKNKRKDTKAKSSKKQKKSKEYYQVGQIQQRFFLFNKTI